MTTYYVRKTGSDSSNGTTPATAWLTIGKALGASGIASGDTVYIGAGVYREKATCALTSPVAETFVIGDVSGAYTGDAGEIRISNYLTNDKTAPTDQNLIDLNGADHLTFRYITFQHTTPTTGTEHAIKAPAISQYIKFEDCAFIQLALNIDDCSDDMINVVGAANTPLHWLIDRCRWFCVGTPDAQIMVDCRQSHTADFDADFVMQNNFVMGCGPLLTFYGAPFNAENNQPSAGGAVLQNCFIFSNDSCPFAVNEVRITAPVCRATNNIIALTAFQAAFNASHDSSCAEDYNYILGTGAYDLSNFTPGAHSISDGSYAPLLHFGQELMQGLSLRPFGMPTVDSPLLGFGDDGNAPAIDILNRLRPAGGQSTAKAVGAYERHDTATAETSVFDVTPAIKIVGPGDHDFYVPVDATATTISVKARYDSNHAATNKPQAILLAQPEIGVSTETKTMTAAAGTWETLTFTQFTPTAAGVVTVRLVSRSAAGNGIAYFDTLAVA